MSDRGGLEPDLVLLTGSQWGQGKTDCILDLATGLQSRGIRVGGFSLRRVYEPGQDGFELHGVEALLFDSGDSIPLARRRYRGDEVVPYRVERTAGLQMGYEDEYHLSHEAVWKLLEAARRDAEDPDLDVFIFDELGPLLMKSKMRNDRRTRPFYDLAVAAVEGPVPVVILVFSDEDIQASAVQGVLQFLRMPPKRYWDRATRLRLSDRNYRYLAGELLQRWCPS